MTVIPLSVLDWYKRDYEDAYHSGDDKRVKCFELLGRGLRTLSDDLGSPLGLDYLKQGQKIAIEINSPCWELKYDYWICVNETRNSLDALNRAIELFTKANKHPYHSCPPVDEIYAHLIAKYINYDPVGYAKKIREALEHCLHDLDVYQATYDTIRWYRIQFEFFIENYDRVLELFPEMRTLALETNQWVVELYLIMAETYYHKRDRRLAKNYAQDALDLSRRYNDIAGIVAALKWQLAISYRFSGRNDWRFRSPIYDEIKKLDKQEYKQYTSEFYADEAGLKQSFGWIGQSVRILYWYGQVLLMRKEREPYIYARSRRNLLDASLQTPAIIRWYLNKRYSVPTIEQQLENVREAAQVLAKPEEFIAEVENLVKKYMR